MTPNRSCLYSVVPSKKKCPARNARPENPGQNTPAVHGYFECTSICCKLQRIYMLFHNAAKFDFKSKYLKCPAHNTRPEIPGPIYPAQNTRPEIRGPKYPAPDILGPKYPARYT